MHVQMENVRRIFQRAEVICGDILGKLIDAEEEVSTKEYPTYGYIEYYKRIVIDVRGKGSTTFAIIMWSNSSDITDIRSIKLLPIVPGVTVTDPYHKNNTFIRVNLSDLAWVPENVGWTSVIMPSVIHIFVTDAGEEVSVAKNDEIEEYKHLFEVEKIS